MSSLKILQKIKMRKHKQFHLFKIGGNFCDILKKEKDYILALKEIFMSYNKRRHIRMLNLQ